MLPLGSELGSEDGPTDVVGELLYRADGPALTDGTADGVALPDGDADGSNVASMPGVLGVGAFTEGCTLTLGDMLRDGIWVGVDDGPELREGESEGAVLPDGATPFDGFHVGGAEGPTDVVGALEGPTDVDGLLEGSELTEGKVDG